jgi:hypothetical protein
LWSRRFSWTVLQWRRMSAAVPKRLPYCGHLWSRRFSWTALQRIPMPPAVPKRLWQCEHLYSRHFSCTVRAWMSRLLGDGKLARQCGQGCGLGLAPRAEDSTLLSASWEENRKN